MEIEQFRRILSYEEGKLCLELGRGILTVYGDDLKIETLSARRLTLVGRSFGRTSRKNRSFYHGTDPALGRHLLFRTEW